VAISPYGNKFTIIQIIRRNDTLLNKVLSERWVREEWHHDTSEKTLKTRRTGCTNYVVVADVVVVVVVRWTVRLRTATISAATTTPQLKVLHTDAHRPTCQSTVTWLRSSNSFIYALTRFFNPFRVQFTKVIREPHQIIRSWYTVTSGTARRGSPPSHYSLYQM